MKTMKQIAKAVNERVVAKRNGTYVSRPVLNAQDWSDWATRHGVPDPIAAADLHVTVCSSLIDVKVPLVNTPMMIATSGGLYAPGAFAMFGPESEAFVFAFSNWSLQDENYSLTSAGAVSQYPTYRPHLTLSTNAKDFDLPDAALSDVPAYIMLGAQVVAPISTPDPTDADSGVEDEDDDDADGGTIIVLVQASAKSDAAQLLQTKGLAPMESSALYDVAKGHRVTRAVAKSLAKKAWATPALKAMAGDSVAPTPKAKGGAERQMTMTLKPVSKALDERLIIKALDEEHRTAIGWASVSTVKGVLVEDLEGDTISTQAQKEWLEDLIKGQRSAKVEHEGEDVGQVVQGIVMDKHLQDALGIDLEMEGVITVTHYTDQKTWDMVKADKWMHSIAGLMLVEVDEPVPGVIATEE